MKIFKYLFISSILMKKTFLIFALLLLFSISVFAAGRGSGGDTTDNAEKAMGAEKLENARGLLKDRIEVKRVTERIREKLATVDAGETGLKCGNLDNIDERVKCRLKLEGEDRYKEAKLQFLPEECRAQEGEKRSRCIRVYKLTQQCWKNDDDKLRVSCVKKNVGLEKPVKEEIASCKELEGDNRTQCVSDLRESVYDSVKFRFYNLEQKAEDLLDNGKIDEATVTKLISDLEAKKIEFNEAGTIREKKIIVNEVKEIWKNFVKAVREYNGGEDES